MAWAVVCHSDRYHVIPVDDLRLHEVGCVCWCRPEEDEEHPEVLTHRALDQRERYESGELKLQ